MKKIKVGDRFGRLKVEKDLGFFCRGTNKTERHWYQCKCDCENITEIKHHCLRDGTTISCGCYNKEMVRNTHKIDNEYYIVDKITYVRYNKSDDCFIIDTDDLPTFLALGLNGWHKTEFGYALKEVSRNNERLLYYAHKVASRTPEGLVGDHINGRAGDNRKANLRNVTQRENTYNKGLPKNNTTGVKGVTVDKTRTKPFVATITNNKKKIFLGCYHELDEAKQVRIEAEKKYFGEFAREEDLPW